MIFTYAPTAHRRRHGPRGYVDYRSFKEWLRDEFRFTCAYCLCRECWFPSPADAFSTDHVIPQSADESRIRDYDNLVYACTRCNARKQNARGLPDPCSTAFGTLLLVNADGTVVSKHRDGLRIIRVLKLDDPGLVEYRNRMLTLFAGSSSGTRWFGFPDDLPDLRLLRPPRGNSRQSGVEDSWFVKRERGTLPDIY
jgi:hypothetical protein